MSKLNDLQNRRSVIEQGGGFDKIEKQHKSGKKTARERMDMLFDAGSFIELDAFVAHRCTDFNMADTTAPGEGVVTGYGTVDGRLVYAYAQDFTVIGGSLGEMHAEKICKVMDMAMKMGAPIVGINDSAGARLQEGVDALKGFGELFRRSAIASGVIPQISMVLGPCAGSAAYLPALGDFTFMVDKTSQMFITGPSVLQSADGTEISLEELGGAKVHASQSGMAAMVCPTEEDCFMQVRELLSLLPSNNLETAPVYECSDDLNRLSANLTDITDAPTDIRDIIREVADNGEFTEFFKDFAPNLVIGFIRMNGATVGVVANQATVSDGALDANASDKGARFVRFCDSFNLPILTFTDVPGYLSSKEQEQNGLIRHGAKLLYAFAEASVPKINVIVKKAYGGAYIAMNSKHLGADIVFAWPTAEIAVMDPAGAANILFREEIADAADPITARQEKINGYIEENTNPYAAAARGYVDDVIEPDSTRPRIISALEMLMSKRETRPGKKHGNIPL